LRKALNCSQPAEALRLLGRVKFDVMKEAKKHDLLNEVAAAKKANGN
jgi:hypothetical protein